MPPVELRPRGRRMPSGSKQLNWLSRLEPVQASVSSGVLVSIRLAANYGVRFQEEESETKHIALSLMSIMMKFHVALMWISHINPLFPNLPIILSSNVLSKLKSTSLLKILTMNMPESNITFVPKQAFAPTPELYDELVASGMEKLAKATLAQIPSIQNCAVIHDNGCGTGAATAAVIAAILDSSIHISIKATDINDHALKIYNKQAADQSWPAEAIHMDSTALSFPDETFTHSIGNAFLFVLPNDGIDAVRETYRTLQPGRIAAFNSWSYNPSLNPIQVAAKATRPTGTPLPRQGKEKWAKTEFLQSVVEKGGFERNKISLVEADVYVTTSEITRYATMLWSFIGGTSAVEWLKSDEEN